MNSWRIFRFLFLMTDTFDLECGAGSATCLSGLCLPERMACDGNSDCGDNSDEAAQCGWYYLFLLE